MKILSLEIQDVLSFQHVKISFEDVGLTLVDGWNYDLDSANGAGKTALFNAMCWCLYGKMPREIGASLMSRTGKKMMCSVEVSVDKHRYTVIRSRQPNTIKVSIDNGDPEEITQDRLDVLLTLTYEQFLLFAYFAQGLGTRFLDLNDTQRKDLFLSMAGIDKFTTAKDKVDADIKSLTAEIATISSSMMRLQERRSGMMVVLESGEEDRSLAQSISKRLLDKRKHLQRLRDNAPERADLSQYEDKQCRLLIQQDKIAEAKGSISVLRRQLSKIREEQEPEDVCDGMCPYCSQPIDIVDNSFHKHDSSSFESKLRSYRNNREKRIADIEESISSFSSLLAKEEPINIALSKIRAVIAAAKEEEAIYLRTIETYKAEIRSDEEQLSRIQSNIARLDKIKAEIERIDSELEQLNLDKAAKESKLLMLKAVAVSIGPTGLPAYIVDDVVETFNEQVQNMLSTVWPQLKYSLTAFKENSDGSVVAKFADNVFLCGRATSVGALSGGERKCLSTVLDLVSMLIFEKLTGRSVETIVLDEPFNDMDFTNRERALVLLRELSSTRHIMVVDHLSELKAQFDRLIMVNKQNGVSVLRSEDG